ncbi:hypothetical protein [Mesorhizobium sp. Root695]|uniref:hypothetical protein n=1 Tax=Mesorhizobium sp. Root695 TaxID=1736589 RepID=UPI0012E3D6DD|nr:hypothetical protein [Mesorhizobium sp. Root695]
MTDALQAIRDRIRWSIDDPRPSLSAAEAEATLKAFFEAEANRTVVGHDKRFPNHDGEPD